MKVLYLTLKKKWFDMIASGEKKEDYREIKTFWMKRLLCDFSWDINKHPIKINADKDVHNKGSFKVKDFTHVRFARGGHFHPSLPQMTIEFKGMELRTGNADWGAESGIEYFVIKLGEIIHDPEEQETVVVLSNGMF